MKAFFHWSWLLPLQHEVFMSPAKDEFAAWLTERFPSCLKVERFSQESKTMKLINLLRGYLSRWD
jgi:hypothetical protein